MKPPASWWTPEHEATWQRVRGYLKASYDYWPQTVPFEEIEAQVRSGECQLWPGPDSALVTVLQETTQGREAYIVLAGGKMDTLATLLEVAEPWFRDQGARRVVFFGRKGWTRGLCAAVGFRETAVTLAKEL